MEHKLSLKDRIALNKELDNLQNLIKKFIGCNHFDVYGILSPESNPSIPIHRNRIPSEDAYFEATLEDVELEYGFTLLDDVSNEYPKWRFTEQDLLDLLEITIPESISKITLLGAGNSIATQAIYNQLQSNIDELGNIIPIPKYIVYRDYLIDLLLKTTNNLHSNSLNQSNLKDENEDSPQIESDFRAYLTDLGIKVLPLLINKYQDAKPKKLALMLHCLQDFGLLNNTIRSFNQDNLTLAVKEMFKKSKLSRQALFYGIDRYETPNISEQTELKVEKLIILETTKQKTLD